MEVLHDLRPERRVTAAPAPGRAGIACAASLVVLLACTNDAKRDLKTADTAVAMSAGGDARDSIAAAESTARRGSAPVDADSSVIAGQASADSLRLGGEPDGASRMVLVVSVADSAAGDTLYRRAGTCQPCHGGRGEGSPGLGPPLNDSLWLHGDGTLPFIQRVTLEGIAVPKQAPRGMPAFAARLTAGDAYKVAAYVYTLSHPHITVPHPFDSVPAIDTAAPP